MEGVIAAIILTAIAVGVILTVYVGKRNRAKQTLLVDKPSQKKSAEWKASQKYALVSFLISSLNKLQEIENKSILCRELILWHENRMNALKFLRRKGELQKESEAIGLVQGDLLELIKERESLLSKFENIVPRTGDKSIATVDDVKGFSCVNGDVLTELLRNPKSCKSNNGNRAGCLVCPNVSEKNAFFRMACYEGEVKEYIDIISNLYSDNIGSEAKLKEFLNNTGWRARMNGRDISLKSNYSENITPRKTEIQVRNPRSEWREWIKTIGVLQTDNSPYQILFRGEIFSFTLREEDNVIYVEIDGGLCKQKPIFAKLLKNVFRKTADCVGCRECEADCHNGCLKIIDGKVKISEDCKHCAECHKVDNGCLVNKSLTMPKGGMGMSQKSLNCYSTHAPKLDWIAQYFRFKDEFDANNDLGSQMYSFFKRFLRDANLLDNKGFTRTARIVERCGLDSQSAWAIMLVNLAYTPQIGWFIKTFDFHENISRSYAVTRLMDDGTQERAANDIWRSYSRFIDLPFSEIGLGVPDKDSAKTVSYTRISWLNPDPKVILYSLYKFSEACGNYKQFSLTRLLNHEIESDGISPTQIFGLDRTTMERILIAEIF